MNTDVTLSKYYKSSIIKDPQHIQALYERMFGSFTVKSQKLHVRIMLWNNQASHETLLLHYLFEAIDSFRNKGHIPWSRKREKVQKRCMR